MKINDELSAVTRNMLQEVDFWVSEKLKGFDLVRLHPFAQDVNDWTDSETGEFFKATMDYLSHLIGRRIRDDVDFAVQIRLDHVVVDDLSNEKRLDYIQTCLTNAVIQFSEYADCSCVVGVPCERHIRA